MARSLGFSLDDDDGDDDNGDDDDDDDHHDDDDGNLQSATISMLQQHAHCA